MKEMGTEDVYNIDVFQVLLKYEISRSSRYPCPLSLLQIKTTPMAVNPEALAEAPTVFAAALNKHLRSADIPARTGNLFTVLLPNSDKHGAEVVCQRLMSVFKNKLEDTKGNTLTFSLQVGVTSHPGGGSVTSGELIGKAEEALRQSMLKGPNTYVYIA